MQSSWSKWMLAGGKKINSWWVPIVRILIYGGCVAELSSGSYDAGIETPRLRLRLDFNQARHRQRCRIFLSSLPPVFSSRSYSPRLTRYPGRRHPHRHRTRRVLLDIHAAGILFDIIRVGSYCTTSHCLCSSDSCADRVTKLVGLPATSHSRLSLSPVSSSTSYSSRLT